jgi:vacuolar-type H+-ATPase subunit H
MEDIGVLEFLQDEVRCLEDDKEELEIRNQELLEANSKAREKVLNVEREMSSLRADFDEKLFQTNNIGFCKHMPDTVKSG